MKQSTWNSARETLWRALAIFRVEASADLAILRANAGDCRRLPLR